MSNVLKIYIYFDYVLVICLLYSLHIPLHKMIFCYKQLTYIAKDCKSCIIAVPWTLNKRKLTREHRTQLGDVR